MENISVIVSEHPQNKEVTLLAVKGFIDTTTAPEFEKKFLTVLGEKKFKLVVDLKDVNYISSAGLRIVLQAAKQMKTKGGRLALCSLREQIREVFNISGFSGILDIAPTAEEAMLRLSA